LNGRQPYVDNLHNVSGSDTHWGHAHAAEALPGIQQPLSWDFWEDTGERAMRDAHYDLGLLTAAERQPGTEASNRLWAIFYGRIALNSDLFQMIHSRVSGAEAAAFGRQVFGVSDTEQPDSPDYDPNGTASIEDKIASHEAFLVEYWNSEAGNIHRWWQENTHPEKFRDAAGSAKRWLEGRKLFQQIQRYHSGASTIAFRTYGELRAFCESVGKPDLETRLTSGLGDTHDADVLNDLWKVSRHTLSLQDFVSEHGYNGPGAGNLHSRVWREDPDALLPLIASYAALGEDESPQAVSRRKTVERVTAEKELLDAAGPELSEKARRLMDRAVQFTRLRELGKVMFLRGVDVARAAARVRGADLARRGLLDDAEDIFFLLASEIMEGDPPNDIKDIVAFRRARHAEYCGFEIPDTWVGNPAPIPNMARRASGNLTGLGVSAGRSEGIVRVVLDPMAAAPLEPGEILVCRTTDPSWGPFFFTAGGLVIDIGGAMSHGAIIAREVGVPCVINTKIGTTQLKTGDRVIVDGNRGTVELLPRA